MRQLSVCTVSSYQTLHCLDITSSYQLGSTTVISVGLLHCLGCWRGTFPADMLGCCIEPRDSETVQLRYRSKGSSQCVVLTELSTVPGLGLLNLPNQLHSTRLGADGPARGSAPFQFVHTRTKTNTRYLDPSHTALPGYPNSINIRYIPGRRPPRVRTCRTSSGGRQRALRAARMLRNARRSHAPTRTRSLPVHATNYSPPVMLIR